jgi:predicted phage-related endonuclease
MAQDSVSVDRYKYIGGSDIPIIMGLSPFKTRWELLQEKAQLVDPEPVANKYIDYGNLMEPLIRDYISTNINVLFTEGKHYLKWNGADVRLHTDGENEERQTILEIKTTSHVFEDIDDYQCYLVQLLFYMSMMKYEFGLLAVYERPEDMSPILDGDRLRLYNITLSEYQDKIAEIDSSVAKFLVDLEKLKANPFLTQEELLPEDIDGLCAQLVALKTQEENLKKVTEERKAVEAKLGELMEQECFKTFDAFGWKFTRVFGKVGETKEIIEFDTKQFEVDHPRLWKKYARKITKTVNRSGSIRLTRCKDD